MVELGAVFEGRYTIQRELGRGSFSIVYLARDRKTDDDVAIKILQPWTQRDDALRHRLRREAQLTAELSSQYSIRVHELGETADGTQFMVMEYLDGDELAATLKREGPMVVERVERIARQVLSALSESHRLGFVHRDLKPENVFLCSDCDQGEVVKVFDFGIAKITGKGIRETTKLTLDGRVIGTPTYMSPEQCRGEALCEASDLYSLGILLYEALTGHVPFDDENPVQMLVLHNTAPVPPLPAAIAETPLARCVMRVLEKSAEDRFASADEFLRALDGRIPIERVSTSTEEQLADPRDSEVPQRLGNGSASSPTRSAYMRWGLISAVGLVVAAIVTWAAVAASR